MTEGRQRLRVTFGCEGALQYISHLDVMRVWERVLKRAELPVTHSQGFTPRPRIALAAPLAVGVTSECEVLEVYFDAPLPLEIVRERLEAQLPPGLSISAVREVGSGLPSLQSSVRAAEYEIELPSDWDATEWQGRIDALLARAEIPWEHKREDKVRRYDLRPLVLELVLVSAEASLARLRMLLRHDERGAGRPEQVALALGAERPPLRIHRAQLRVAEPDLARAAYRAAGRQAD